MEKSMARRIEKAQKIGLCYGIRRALDMLDKALAKGAQVETLGAIAHNQQVLRGLEGKGARVARGLEDIHGNLVAIGAHGVGPQVFAELESRHIRVIDTTCPFVRRAQKAAQQFAEAGFDVVIFGDAAHTEVKGILGWTNGRGTATLDERLTNISLSRRIGILSQTTQIPDHFIAFTKRIIDAALTKDAQLRIIDTICHDTRERQEATLELAGKVDLMLVIGSHGSANTNRLTELCSRFTPTYLVESEGEITPSLLAGHEHIGIAAGASTPEQAIDEVIGHIEALT